MSQCVRADAVAMTVSFRLSPQEIAAVDRLCARWRCNRSEAIRRALRAADEREDG